MEKKVRLGIIGVGNMGTSHAKHIVLEKLCPNIELTAVADVNPERLKYVRENISQEIACFDDAIKMMDSGLVDACLVSVPHYDHPKYVMAAMQRGLHPMCEKPAGVYVKQVREMNAEADKHPELKFGMMFNQRSNSLYQKMRELVQSGKYGNIRRTNWLITNWYRPQAYYDSGEWRATWSGEGGGVLLNQCPHQLDLWQWICGMPVKVETKMHFGLWHDIEVDDDVTTYVEYANGATGVFITSTGDACGSNRFEVQMDGAKMVVEDGKLHLWEFETTEQEFSKTNKKSFGHVETTETVIEPEEAIEQHCIVLNAWADAILGSGTMLADGREGINGLSISNAMHMSAFTNSAVTLPLDDEAYYQELMKRVATSRRKENVTAVVEDTSSSYNPA